MVRSLWLRALATTLVWTGVAWAQQPSSSGNDKSAEQILTIQEAGKSPQKCQVVKTFRTSDGHQAYQVRAVDTGEMMTITEKASSTSTYGARPQSIATQIYHWGRQKVSPPGVPAPAVEKTAAAKTPYQMGATTAKPSGSSAADAAKSVASNPSPSTYKSPAALAGGSVVTQPVPEKDWRQSWIKSEEKPLRIDDKLKAKENLADVPPLRIESKSAVKDIASELPPVKINESATKSAVAVLPRPDNKPATTPAVATAKSGLSADDPFLNPDKYMPKTLDITPRKKVDSSTAAHTPGALESGPKAEQKTSRVVPEEPKAARIPTLAGVAGGMGETTITIPAPEKTKAVTEVGKSSGVALSPATPEAVTSKLVPALPAPDKSMVVFDLSKMTPPPTGPDKPAGTQQAVVPELPLLAEKKATGEAGPAKSSVTIPLLPLAPEPVTAAAPIVEQEKSKVAGADKNAIGHAMVSSTPAIPSMPLQAVAPPAPLALAAPPAAIKMPAPPAEAGAERPSFVVLDAKGAEGDDRAIKLPGVPNAVVAFGQPATVTSPPPDLVRKKTLETHTVRVMISQLKESLYPSQRERAAEGLTSANWKVHPQVVEALCLAALDDPAPAVRGRCAESLATMNVRSQAALGVIHKLQADKDEAVRSKAEEALKLLEPEELPH